MPLRWEPGKNPYRRTYFLCLGLGPGRSPQEVVAQAKGVSTRLKGGQKILVGGRELEDREVSEASSRLRQADVLAEEILLAHPPAGTTKAGKAEELQRALDALAVAPDEPAIPPLLHPLALFWFTPSPGGAATAYPPWGAFRLVEPGDAEDLAFDIVYDS